MTEEQARKLAEEVLEKAKKGADFTALVKKYTADRVPGKPPAAGIYGMCPNDPAPEGFVPRTKMVPAFGDVSFSLKPGEIGMAPYDPKTSPYGWHIIKRLK